MHYVLGAGWPDPSACRPAPTRHIIASSALESFFATLKNEMYSLRPWATRAEARHAVVGLIEAYYNRRRPHSTIGYQVPAERMAAFMERAERAFSEDEGAMPMAA